MTDARRLLAGLRHGQAVSPDEIRWFAGATGDGTASDAQIGAFAMAVCMGGLGREARVALTKAMRDSGEVLRWDLPGPVIDKHSSGGIGDCVSLILAPALAVCGGYVPMVSGRGLGHTGGTLDKLEAIPGYRTGVPPGALHDQLARVGCGIVAASGRIAPADRRLYAVRDVTGTVESLDLITASILSKKLAAGLGALILDVKAGSGAFMKTMDEARALADSLVGTANGAGCTTAALVTDMSQPLASAAGNALEVAAAMRVLRGEPGEARLMEVTRALGGALLSLAGLAGGPEAGAHAISEAVRSGRAGERFARMVAAQGGAAGIVERPEAHLPAAPVIRDVPAPAEGVVAAIETEEIGHAVIALGGGRRVETDSIDPAVGVDAIAGIGTPVGPGRPLARVHAGSPDAAEAAARSLAGAVTIADAAEAPDLIRMRVGP